MSLPWSRDTLLIFALEIGVLAAVLALGAYVMRRRGRAALSLRLMISSGIAWTLALGASVLAFTIATTLPVPPVPFTAQFRTNPVPDSEESVSAGRALYQQSCVICHGPRGLGDGAAAFAMRPRPVNLQLHVPQHPDGFIEYWISEGVPGTQMPAWKEQFTPEQRWQLVRYLRRLAAGGP